MKERIALFIDGGGLEKITSYFGNIPIDYNKLTEFMAMGKPLLRCYYYHCLPYQSSPPTQDEQSKFSSKQKFFRKLNRLNDFTVRLGKLEFRGFDKEGGKPIFEQKRVDVHLATDLVMHSTKHIITHAALLTGDSDFLPAIEIAKSEGVHITLFYSEESDLRAHDELIDAVDERKKMAKICLIT
jgi:uncharacterized LabA/DUF88 family protein